MSKDNFSCYYCGGKINSQKQDIDFRWSGELFLVKDVPVLVCNQCGEKYYSAKVSEKLDRIATKKYEAKKFLKIPVFEWKNIAGFFRYA